MKKGSKYYPLHQYLHENHQAEITLTFDEIERLIGVLPASAHTNPSWWSNRRTGAAQALAWMNAGYHVVAVDLATAQVTFRKPTLVYHIRRIGNTVLWDSEMIKALRQHMGATQAELAEEIGVRQQTISEWELGLYQPKRAMSKLLTLTAERANFTYAEADPPAA